MLNKLYFQVILAATLVAAAAAIPAYQYGVNDDYSKTNFKKTETQDASGNVAGSYIIVLPDGRIQTTTYRKKRANPTEDKVNKKKKNKKNNNKNQDKKNKNKFTTEMLRKQTK